MQYFNVDFLNFFKELAANNNKEWFDNNRSRYEQNVREPFKVFVQSIIDILKKEDKKIAIEPKDAIFRINRDIRFSKDKTPYKLHVGAIISPAGKKDKGYPGLYMELGPEHLRVYGGVYTLEKEELYDVREYIAQNSQTLNKLLKHKNFVSHFGELRGAKNKRLPKEFEEAAKQQPLIYNKSFYYFETFEPELIISNKLVETVTNSYNAGKQVKDFLAKGLRKG